MTKSSLQEIPLHLELADLLVKLWNGLFVSFILLVNIIVEDTGGALHQDLLPFVDLARVNLKPAGQYWRNRPF
jgi:hypothetical protein